MVVVETAAVSPWTFADFSVIQHFGHVIFNMQRLSYDKLPVTINITSNPNNRPVMVYLLVPTMQYPPAGHTHLPVSEKENPHTKCPTSLAQCLAKIEVIYMEQIVSY
jgi:hypothetical protein